MKRLILVLFTTLITFGLTGALFFQSSSLSIGEQIHFQNKDGSFTYAVIPSKGKEVTHLEEAFTAHKAQAERPDDQLYRITPINYLKVGKWAEYKMLPAWQYPYLPKRKR